MAIVAVHGVADQQPGQTAQALADLLVVASPRAQPGGPQYAVTESDALGLRVVTLAPSDTGRAAAAGVPCTADLPWPQRLAKAWRQSLGSDLHRRPAAPQGPGLAGAATLRQPDVELTDFLLAQSQRNETPDAVYDTLRLALRRDAQAGDTPGSTEMLHIYEMYWSDLSRLAGNVPRILTELFTLISRLSQLGRDTVAAGARQFSASGPQPGAWRALDATQAALDWLFSRLLAQLMLQLLMIVLVIAPLGWLVGQALWQVRLAMVLAVLLPGGAWLVWVYARAPGRVTTVLTALLALLTGWLLATQLRHATLVGLAWLALLALFTDWLLRVCEARFPMTRRVGAALGLISLATVLASGVFGSDAQAVAAGGPHAGDRLLLFQTGALQAMELLLLATVGCWLLIAPTMLAWFILGLQCDATRGYAGSATVATGRLGLFASLAFFLTLVMGGWALLHPLLLAGVKDMLYEPFIFRLREYVSDGSAAAFLTLRYQNSTETFAMVAILVFAVVIYLVVGMLPSLLAELGWLAALTGSQMAAQTQPLALGRWLTRTYRYLDLMMKTLIGVAVVAVVLVALDLWFSRWTDYPAITLRELMAWVRGKSQDALSPLTLALTAASATAVITALGGLLSRYVPGLRAPLDMALDVDSHFREFPRLGIPRSRIFSRFAALLRHVHEQGYERIVIVAHSQGTVLSAELLRYLSARAADPADAGEAAELGRALAGRVHLMTAGCPLRQLYASRFPVLYPWVMQMQQRQPPQSPIPAEEAGVAVPRVGPSVAAIGVQRWINVYTTGDYVGRWLWSRPPEPGHDRSDTILDALDVHQDVYRPPASTAAALLQLAQPGAQVDVCLGCGAHTHYFETDQLLVAALIDRLAMSPWPAPAPSPAQLKAEAEAT